MYRVHKCTGMCWRYILVNPVAQIKYMPFTLAKARQNGTNLLLNTRRGCIQNRRIHVACKATLSPTRRRASAISVVQSRPSASQPVAAIASSHGPPPLVNKVTGTRRPSFSRIKPSTIYAYNSMRTHDNHGLSVPLPRYQRS